MRCSRESIIKKFNTYIYLGYKPHFSSDFHSLYMKIINSIVENIKV